MAVAKIVCGECGNVLSPGVTACPKCGALVEIPAAGAREAEQVCTSCGFHNPASAAYCESCGAKLPGAAAAGKPSARQKNAGSMQGKLKISGKPAKGPRVEVWQITSGVAVLALIAVLVYMLMPHDQSRPSGSPPAVQPQATASMAEIATLQQAVSANPRDAASRLRLANVLHDNGMLTAAVQNYNEYLKLDPKDPNARVDLGICYDQLALQDSANAPQYFGQAVQEMEKAMKESPTHQPAAFNLGIVNLHMGNLEESNKWFKRAVELGHDTELGTRAQKILQQHTFPQ